MTTLELFWCGWCIGAEAGPGFLKQRYMLGADFPRSDRFDIATSIPFSFYDYMIAQVNDEL